ncbi:MAG: hypothetical protein LAP21_22110 [Acidobacteriia bacterium]|nr:hypothetical protein [Terriglobia bacterium]
MFDSRKQFSLSLGRLTSVLLALTIISCCACGGGGGTAPVAQNPPPTTTPPPPPPPATGLLMTIGSATVPPGGIFQYQLLLTEPKPLSHASTQPTVPTSTLGPVRGIAVNDASGQATGVAVISGTNFDITLSSPNLTLGTDTSYPLFTMTMPVLPSSTVGSSFPVTLGSTSAFFDTTGQGVIQELTPGTLTIGGTLAITDVIPGGGLVPAGGTIRILGTGFLATTKINFPDPIIVTTTNFISSTEIDVTLNIAAQLDGERIRAIQPTNANETSTYYSYLRADPVAGSSADALVNQFYPLFSQQTYTKATIPLNNAAPKLTALALQNTSASAATATIELLDSAGNVVATLASGVSLPSRTRIVRDVVQDWFPSPPASAVTVRVTSKTTALQMLGILGDSSTSKAAPITPTVVP